MRGLVLKSPLCLVDNNDDFERKWTEMENRQGKSSFLLSCRFLPKAQMCPLC